MRKCNSALWVFPLAMCLISVVNAEVTSRGGGDSAALAKAQYMLREMAVEKEALQAESAKLREDLAGRDKAIEALNRKLELTNKSLDHTEGTVGKYAEAVAAQREKLAETRDKVQKLVDKYRELVMSLRLVEEERAGLQARATEQIQTLADCALKNRNLYQVNIDLLSQYQQKGILDALLQREPITQLKRAEIESLVEEMNTRIDRLKVPYGVAAAAGD